MREAAHKDRSEVRPGVRTAGCGPNAANEPGIRGSNSSQDLLFVEVQAKPQPAVMIVFALPTFRTVVERVSGTSDCYDVKAPRSILNFTLDCSKKKARGVSDWVAITATSSG